MCLLLNESCRLTKPLCRLTNEPLCRLTNEPLCRLTNEPLCRLVNESFYRLMRESFTFVRLQGPFSTLRYDVIGDDNAPVYFSINPVTGEVSTRTSLFSDLTTTYKVRHRTAPRALGGTGLQHTHTHTHTYTHTHTHARTYTHTHTHTHAHTHTLTHTQRKKL